MGEGVQWQSAVTDEDLARYESLIRREAANHAWNVVTQHWDADLFEDLQQEARLEILRELPRHDPARGSLRGFLSVCISCRMKGYLGKQFRQQRVPAYKVTDERRQHPEPGVVVSLDGLAGTDKMAAFADDSAQREAELRTQIALALPRARLTVFQNAALMANLGRHLTKPELTLVLKAQRKIRRAIGLGESTTRSTGRPQSAETRAKISAALRGRKLPAETCKKLRVAHKGIGLGRQVSSETRSKIAAKSRGRRCTEATKELLRQHALGRTMSDEAKGKLRRANLGRKHTPETCEKIRSAALKRSRERRASAGEAP